ncbi:winged helix-turn-helix domain-containing protein [Delftia acidovorans]|uniref:Winged helix-turn-helix domain-containing protein n=1 Tax=Delftia acidovorans TaxID=80866 RepID=A0AAJ2VAP3_DELAC|nr:winged helix-turn-helix domain-containing protein [Delftia acidovorans]MDX4954752.1 winged helix-turn-helix domain-containing protein [Delftia acidovorans]
MVQLIMLMVLIRPPAGVPHYLRETLCEFGYIFEEFSDYHSGLRYAINNEINLIIIYEDKILLERIKFFAKFNTNRYLPMMILTKIKDSKDREVFFDNGAKIDSEVSEFSESFIKRIEQLKSRLLIEFNKRECYCLGDLILDLSKQRAERKGKRLDLTKGEFSLLLEFMRRSGQLLSRQSLAALVWNRDGNFTKNMVEVAVRRLRKKLDDPYDIKLLHTQRGSGYILEIRNVKSKIVEIGEIPEDN